MERRGQTMADPAWEAFRLASQLANGGRLLASVEHGERALVLAIEALDWELAGPALLGLANVYERLHRYRQQARTLQHYIPLLEGAPEAMTYMPDAYYSLGAALFQHSEHDAAVNHLIKAHETSEEPGLADRCRHLLRCIALQRGDAAGFRTWLARSERYLSNHPEDTEAAFHFWYDQAALKISKGDHTHAVAKALKALRAAHGDAEAEYMSLWLLHRCALANEDWHDALQFAVAARISALEGWRPDLCAETGEAIISLVDQEGPELLFGVHRYYAAQGLDLFRYVPENLLSSHRNDRGAIGFVSEDVGALARVGRVQALS